MKPRIAVFDPSPNILTLFKAVLSQNGYAVYPYDQELMDVEQVEGIRPSLIILGYFKGYSAAEAEVIRRLRARPSIRNIPIMVCTTGAVELPDDEATAQVSIFPKPFHVKDLLTAVQNTLTSAVGV